MLVLRHWRPKCLVCILSNLSAYSWSMVCRTLNIFFRMGADLKMINIMTRERLYLVNLFKMRSRLMHEKTLRQRNTDESPFSSSSASSSGCLPMMQLGKSSWLWLFFDWIKLAMFRLKNLRMSGTQLAKSKCWLMNSNLKWRISIKPNRSFGNSKFTVPCWSRCTKVSKRFTKTYQLQIISKFYQDIQTSGNTKVSPRINNVLPWITKIL